MPTIFNVSAFPLVVDHAQPAVMPGKPVTLDDERAAALLLSGEWSDRNPREKPSRAKAQPASPDTHPPAKTGEETQA